MKTLDRGLVLQFFEVTMNLVPIGVICIFGNQYIMANFLQYLMFVLINFSLDFCVCEYVDVVQCQRNGQTQVKDLEVFSAISLIRV